MSGSRRLIALTLIMAGVVIAVATIVFYVLYTAAFAEERERLVETAQSQARLIEAVARFNAIYSSDYPEVRVPNSLCIAPASSFVIPAPIWHSQTREYAFGKE